jgi:type II secretory pathway pseudopilin PulG
LFATLKWLWSMRSGVPCSVPRSHDRCAGGFTYLGVLIAIVILGLSLATVGGVVRTAAIREQETDLMFVGDQIRRAIVAYYDTHPNSALRYPRTLEELSEDNSQGEVYRKLRQPYLDPLTGNAEWGLIKSRDGGIMGVYSMGSGTPIKQDHFQPLYSAFADAVSYADWKFVYAPGQEAAAAMNPRPQPVAGAQTPPTPTVPILGQESAPIVVSRGKLNCGALAARDQAECARQQAKWGDSLGCQSSAAMRKDACEAGNSLPPLFIRYE